MARTHDAVEAAPTVRDASGAIVLVAAEDDRFSEVRTAALDLARREDRPVIVYDWDAPGLLSEPLPTWWSGDGPGERPPGPMDPHQLEVAGRGAIGRQVAELQRDGVPAAGWLPRRQGAAALGAYALEHGAAVLVVPADLPDIATLLPPDGAVPSATSPTAAIRVLRVEAGERR